MTATPWPPMLACHKCGGRGYRNLGPQGWCEQHLAELFGSFAPHIYMTDEQRLAAVMKADGKPSHGELGHVRKFFARQFGPAHSAELLRLLRDVLKRDVQLREVCAQIRGHLSHPERLQIMHYLIGLAHSDGNIHVAEHRVLEAIAADLGISAKDLASLDAMFRGPTTSSAYTILEVDPKAGDDEVKKAYRRMAMKHHPDRVAHLGEEFQKAASEKFKNVQQAYERIERERGMK